MKIVFMAIMQFWLNNKYSMLYFVSMVHMGIKGIVKDAEGRAIAGAMAKVQGNGKIIETSNMGEFWKILMPGNYTIVSCSYNYF